MGTLSQIGPVAARPGDGKPVGPRGISFLRRVFLAGGTYRLSTNADRDAIGRALSAGFIVSVGRHHVQLTEAGEKFLHRMRSAH
ncbi:MULTISPECIES: hypothetical protein [unclassified Rhizobium]